MRKRHLLTNSCLLKCTCTVRLETSKRSPSHNTSFELNFARTRSRGRKFYGDGRYKVSPAGFSCPAARKPRNSLLARKIWYQPAVTSLYACLWLNRTFDVLVRSHTFIPHSIEILLRCLNLKVVHVWIRDRRDLVLRTWLAFLVDPKFPQFLTLASHISRWKHHKTTIHTSL